MGTTYEIWCGGRLVAFRNTESLARNVVVEHLRSAGCSDDEVVRVDRTAMNWQGDVYRAVALGSMESSPEVVACWTKRAALA